MLSHLGMAFFIMTDAMAAEYVMTPSVKLRETYDDNVHFRNVDDFEHLISPRLELEARSERVQFKTTCNWDVSKYQRHDELDSVDQTYGLSTSLAPSQILQLNFSGTYVDDYTFASTLEESGLVAERSRRKRGTAQPGVTFAVDARNSLQFSYDFTDAEYDLESYADYEINGAGLNWFYDFMNERTRLVFTASGDQVDFEQDDGDLRQRTYQCSIGFDHKPSETLQVMIKAGGSHTESQRSELVVTFEWPNSFKLKTETVEEEHSGYVLQGSLDWRLERFALSASLDRDIVPSIYGENMTRNRVRTNMSYRLTESLRCALAGDYYRSETEGLIQEEKHQTYSVRPSVTFKFSEDIDLQLGYAYTWTQNEITDRSEDRNRVFFQIAAALPVHFD